MMEWSLPSKQPPNVEESRMSFHYNGTTQRRGSRFSGEKDTDCEGIESESHTCSQVDSSVKINMIIHKNSSQNQLKDEPVITKLFLCPCRWPVIIMFLI